MWGFRVRGLGLRVQSLGLGFRDLGSRAESSKLGT